MDEKRFLEEKDLIKFNFIVDNGEKKYQNTEMVELILGDNNFINGIDDKLIGKEVEGPDFSFPFQMPKNSNFFPGENVIFNLELIEWKKPNTDDNLFEEIEHDDEELEESSKQKRRNTKEFNKKEKNKCKNHKEQINTLELENKKQKSLFDEKQKTFLLKINELESKAKDKIDEHLKHEKEKMNKEIENIKKYSTQKLAEELIDPIINMEKAISFASTKGSDEVMAYSKGFVLLIKQIFSVLEDNGLVEINPKKGSEFNPELHHIFEFSLDTDLDNNLIVETKTKGFSLHGRVIKPASVIVSKK